MPSLLLGLYARLSDCPPSSSEHRGTVDKWAGAHRSSYPRQAVGHSPASLQVGGGGPASTYKFWWRPGAVWEVPKSLTSAPTMPTDKCCGMPTPCVWGFVGAGAMLGLRGFWSALTTPDEV